MVVEWLDEPATVSTIAEAADVAWATADSELDRLVAEDRVRVVETDGETRYEPHPVQLFLDQILDLIERHDREALETQLAEYQTRVEELRETYGVATAAELRERLTEGGLSSDEMREIRDAADTWEALETELRIHRHALQLYDDVTRIADSDTDGERLSA